MVLANCLGVRELVCTCAWGVCVRGAHACMGGRCVMGGQMRAWGEACAWGAYVCMCAAWTAPCCHTRCLPSQLSVPGWWLDLLRPLCLVAHADSRCMHKDF